MSVSAFLGPFYHFGIVLPGRAKFFSLFISFSTAFLFPPAQLTDDFLELPFFRNRENMHLFVQDFLPFALSLPILLILFILIIADLKISISCLR